MNHYIFIALFLIAQTIAPTGPIESRFNNVLVQPPYVCGAQHLSKPLRVAVLGNSLAWSPPQSNFNWAQSNGMAATTIENDYPHIICEGLAEKHRQAVALLVIQAWDIETAINQNTAWNRDYAAVINNFGPDVLVVQFSDNVVNLDAVPRFEPVYNGLLDTVTTKALVCVSGWYQTRPPLNEAIQAACAKRSGHYVTIGDIYLAANMRGSSFDTGMNTGVGSHPNNLGHYEIARRIVGAITGE